VACNRLGIVCLCASTFNCGGDDLITEEYLRSHLFRRLKNGPHGQIVELYAAVLSRTSSLARACRRRRAVRCQTMPDGSRTTIGVHRRKLLFLRYQSSDEVDPCRNLVRGRHPVADLGEVSQPVQQTGVRRRSGAPPLLDLCRNPLNQMVAVRAFASKAIILLRSVGIGCDYRGLVS
jgi:hypothetical protein